MSDTPQGPGWWRASDALWYPPETHPDYTPPPPPPGTAYRNDPPPVAHEPAKPPTDFPTTPPPALPEPVVETAERSPWFWVGISVIGFAVVAVVAVAIIGLLLAEEGPPAVSAADVTVESTGVLAPVEAFVTTGLQTDDGLLVFGTTDDPAATAAEIWDASVLTEGIGPAAVVGGIELPVGVPYVYGVTTTPDGYLAGGEVFFSESGDSQAAFFSSPDGLDWSFVAPPASLDMIAAVFDVAIVGDVRIALVADGDDIVNHLYRSDDGGERWERAGIGFDAVTVWGIGASADRFYAVGDTVDADGVSLPTLHASSDGIRWTEQRFVFDGAFVTGRLFDVVGTSAGFVAVGTTGSSALVMFSNDGQVWERVPVPIAVEGAEALTTVVASDNGAVAIGQIDDRYTFWEIDFGE